MEPCDEPSLGGGELVPRLVDLCVQAVYARVIRYADAPLPVDVVDLLRRRPIVCTVAEHLDGFHVLRPDAFMHVEDRRTQGMVPSCDPQHRRITVDFRPLVHLFAFPNQRWIGAVGLDSLEVWDVLLCERLFRYTPPAAEEDELPDPTAGATAMPVATHGAATAPPPEIQPGTGAAFAPGPVAAATATVVATATSSADDGAAGNPQQAGTGDVAVVSAAAAGAMSVADALVSEPALPPAPVPDGILEESLTAVSVAPHRFAVALSNRLVVTLVRFASVVGTAEQPIILAVARDIVTMAIVRYFTIPASMLIRAFACVSFDKRSLVVADAGRVLLFQCEYGYVAFDVATGEPLACSMAVRKFDGPVTAVAELAWPRLAVAVSGHLEFVDASTSARLGEPLVLPPLSPPQPTAGRSPGLATTVMNRTIRADRTPISPLIEHIVVVGEQYVVVAGAVLGSLRLLDLAQRRVMRQFTCTARNAELVGLALLCPGVVAASTDDECMYIFEVHSGRQLRVIHSACAHGMTSLVPADAMVSLRAMSVRRARFKTAAGGIERLPSGCVVS